MDLCKQNFIKAVDEIPLGLQRDFGPSHMIKQSENFKFKFAKDARGIFDVLKLIIAFLGHNLAG